MSNEPAIEPEQFIEQLPDVLPLLPLRDAVLFPYSIAPFSVSRERSAVAVENALAGHRMIMLAGQRDPAVDVPRQGDLYSLGTAALIMRMLRMPDGRSRILVQGLTRAKILHLSEGTDLDEVQIEAVAAAEAPPLTAKVKALMRSVRELLDQAAGYGRPVSEEVALIAANLEHPGRLADLVASNLELELSDAQDLLEERDPVARLVTVHEHLVQEVELSRLQSEFSSRAQVEMDRGQREFMLRQQLRSIQQELGESDELAEEIEQYRQLARDKRFPDDACEELERQIRRLEKAHPDSAEATVIRTYLEWLSGLPWGVVSEDDLDLDRAEAVLADDHFGLEQVKERIVEYLAVRALNPEARGPILCFIGPPGVGKTSLGRSIARALGRQFVRLSLGGIRDEAEIRGHRRTYVGALPGRILQGLQQAGTNNPVFMLDEIDKIGMDFRGDPSSALLEVLDPEQNHDFRDHYLSVSYDLSRVLFLATGNLVDPIQPAFRDRLEILRISGYTTEEKIEIARRHLVPKLLGNHGIEEGLLQLTPKALRAIVRSYTREAGVRGLERRIATICRRRAVQVARGDEKPYRVTPKRLRALLGPEEQRLERNLEENRVGVATGMAWTAAGGELMFIEALQVPGHGKLQLTGQLGEVMRESAMAALSYARLKAAGCGPGAGTIEGLDVHVHVPAGSVPKDGPSAGVPIASALVSLLTARPLRAAVAMSGEINLQGDVLAVGGIKEKVLAAREAGIGEVVLPRRNEQDLDEIPRALRRDLRFHLVETMDDVLGVVLAET